MASQHLGYASAMRRAELVGLNLIDVEHKPAGLLLLIRQSKMDQEGHGQQVAVAHGRHAVTDPVAALTAWRLVRGDAPGALTCAGAGAQLGLQGLLRARSTEVSSPP